jgi:pimeloyl-ACP methyl ester carboxylesterase
MGVSPIVAVFVHGWKNNASKDNSNVWGFRMMLAGLSKQYNRAPVLGIYIGWRGAVLSPPILKEFTIWNRRRKSQNLPGAHMAEALVKIMQAAKGIDYSDDSTITLLIGHSLGGAVLETALTETILAQVVKRTAHQDVVWPATLIMFINEAQEALQSYQLAEAFHKNLPARVPCQPGGTRNNVPALVSISSTADYATRAFFPGSQGVLRPFNSLRKYSADNPNFLGFGNQVPMFFNTTAHLGPFRTHLMGREDDPEVKAAADQCKPIVRTTIADVTYLIVDKPGSKNLTPYWVMHAPASLVPDHSTIFTPAFTKLLISFIFTSTTR